MNYDFNLKVGDVVALRSSYAMLLHSKGSALPMDLSILMTVKSISEDTITTIFWDGKDFKTYDFPHGVLNKWD